MSDPTSLTVPDAGWYADRNDANMVRWWDGSQWTDHTHSIAPEQNVAQPVSASAFGFTPVEPNPLAAAHAADAVAAVGQVAPGWYPDNADPSIQRWWDGTQWTAHTAPRVAVPSPSAAAYLGADATPLVPYGTASPGGMRSATNTTATLAMIFSLVSFAGLIFAPLLLLALAGIVTGIVALRRVKLYAPPGGRRGQAIAGVVVGAVSLVATILLTVAAVSVYEQVHHGSSPQNATQSGTRSFLPSTVAELKQDLAKSFASQFEDDYPVTVSQVDCDPSASMVAGATFRCQVVVNDGRQAAADVNITSAASSGHGTGWGASWGKLMLPPASPDSLTLDMIKQDISYISHYENDAHVTDVECPTASLAVGAVFRCSVLFDDGRAGLDQVSVLGAKTYQLAVVAQPSDVNSGSNPDLSHS